MSLISVVSRQRLRIQSCPSISPHDFLNCVSLRKDVNFAELLNANRYPDAGELLSEGVYLVGAIGERSTRAALEAAARICADDLLSTIFFMNKIHPGLERQTPLERAEQSDEGLEFVIDMIGATEAGVYI